MNDELRKIQTTKNQKNNLDGRGEIEESEMLHLRIMKNQTDLQAIFELRKITKHVPGYSNCEKSPRLEMTAVAVVIIDGETIIDLVGIEGIRHIEGEGGEPLICDYVIATVNPE
ncbi:hypothetical protein L1887_23721 [Cichorium endivia]|nr:hypothetical protein L1887_23721 [Cichorium endivia]